MSRTDRAELTAAFSFSDCDRTTACAAFSFSSSKRMCALSASTFCRAISTSFSATTPGVAEAAFSLR